MSKLKEVTITRLAKETLQTPNPKNPRLSDFHTVEVSRSYTLEAPTGEEVEKMSEKLFGDVTRDLQYDMADEVKDLFERRQK